MTFLINLKKYTTKSIIKTEYSKSIFEIATKQFVKFTLKFVISDCSIF
jgi:hypothetical protein